MSEENTQVSDAEMLSVAQEAIDGASEASEPVWEDTGPSVDLEAESQDDAEGQSAAPEDGSESAPSEPQSDEKQEPEQKLIPESTFKRLIAEERQKKRDAYKKTEELEAKFIELQEMYRLQQERLQQQLQLIQEREAMDPMEYRIQEQQHQLRQMEAQKRIQAQQQQLRQRAEFEQQKAELKQQYMEEAAELESQTGVPAAQILIAFAEAGDKPMKDVAQDLHNRAFKLFKEKMAKERNSVLENTPRPMPTGKGARRDLTQWKSEEELEANMYAALKADGFLGS